MKKLFAAVACAALCASAFAAGEAVPAAVGADPYAQNIVRLSRISVDPAQLDAYKQYVAEVGRESMKNEPGVRVLYSMQEQKRPTEFTILEIYASPEAYQHHIKTAHFQKYKQGTKDMVKALELVDCNPLVPEALIKPAK